MITNILATIAISIVTNITIKDGPKDRWVMEGGLIRIVTDTPSERYQTTTVAEVATIQFQFGGEKYERFFSEKIISSVTRTLKLKEQWEEVRVETNDLSFYHSHVWELTNKIHWTNRVEQYGIPTHQ